MCIRDRRCIRVLINWNTDTVPHDIVHVYLRGARNLRPDKADLPLAPVDDLEGWIQQQVDHWQDQKSARKEKRMKIVAFQGEHGAYSEQAVRQHFGEEVVTCLLYTSRCV